MLLYFGLILRNRAARDDEFSRAGYTSADRPCALGVILPPREFGSGYRCFKGAPPNLALSAIRKTVPVSRPSAKAAFPARSIYVYPYPLFGFTHNPDETGFEEQYSWNSETPRAPVSRGCR